MIINSRTFGKVEFTRRGCYLYVQFEGDRAPVQVCAGGRFKGATVMTSETTFERDARKWYKQAQRLQRLCQVNYGPCDFYGDDPY